MIPIRQRRIYLIVEKTSAVASSEKKSKFESIREVIGLISAITGIFAVLLYLAGRSFAAGYFSAMNIPSYQVSFSLWEYGEVAWIPLLLYPVGMIILTSLLSGIFSRFMDLLSPLIIRFVKWLRSKFKLKLPTFHLPESSTETRFWFSTAKRSFYILLLMYLVIFTLKFVTDFGKLNGRFHLLENSVPVELSSTLPMPLDDDTLAGAKASGHDYYTYKGLYLLTVNDGKYFLFREINSDTCGPEKVYVVESSESLKLNLLPVVSLTNKCNIDARPNIVATPTAAQSAP